MNDTIFYLFYNLAHQSIFLDKLVVFSAVYLPYIVVLFALIFLFRQRASWKVFGLVFFSSGLAWFLAKVLKILIHAYRPFLHLPNVNSLFAETGFAFPSGHAAFFGALAVSLFFYRKKAGYLFMFLGLLIGVARIVGGVHFPIDILGGFVLGSLVAYFLRNIYPHT